MEETKERMSELETRITESTQPEQQSIKKKNEQSLRDLGKY